MQKIYLQTLTVISLLLLACASYAEQQAAISIQLSASNEFTFVDQETSVFNINTLNPAHQSVETLQDVEAIGIVYLGNISLAEDATPLSVLREISAQISRGLDIDFALIADSTTSQSLAPHELLLLYHPTIAITLGLTKVEGSTAYSLIGTYAMPSQSAQTTNNAASQEE